MDKIPRHSTRSRPKRAAGGAAPSVAAARTAPRGAGSRSSPRGVRRRRPAPAPDGTLFSVAGRLNGVIDRLEDAVGRLHDAARDPEAIHDLRVASRRLRGAISAARQVGGELNKSKRVARRLRELRTGLGGARQAEVGLELLAGLRRELTPEELPAAGAIAALLARRLEEFRTGLPDTLRRLKLDRLLRESRALAGALEEARPAPPAPRAGGDRRGQAAAPGGHHSSDPAARRSAALEAVAARHQALAELPRGPLAELDDVALHRFRIEAKKLRYTLEFFAPLFPGAEERLGKLREAQDLLGALHDLADLGILAADLAGRARVAGFESAEVPFERLGARLEQRRRRDGRRFRRLHEALTGAGFLAGLGSPEDPEDG